MSLPKRTPSYYDGVTRTWSGCISSNRAMTEIERGEEAFDFCDQKGRVVGYQWNIQTVTVTLVEDQKLGRYLHPDNWPLNYFIVWGSPTRNGSGYGPAFNDTEVETLEEARALVVKRINNARKRDAKKFAGAK